MSEVVRDALRLYIEERELRRLERLERLRLRQDPSERNDAELRYGRVNGDSQAAGGPRRNWSRTCSGHRFYKSALQGGSPS